METREKEWFNFLGRRFAVHKFRELLEQKPHRFHTSVQSAASIIGFNFLVQVDKGYAAQLSEERLKEPLYVVMLTEDAPLLIDGHQRLQRLYEEGRDVTLIVAQHRMTKYIETDE